MNLVWGPKEHKTNRQIFRNFQMLQVLRHLRECLGHLSSGSISFILALAIGTVLCSGIHGFVPRP